MKIHPAIRLLVLGLILAATCAAAFAAPQRMF
jgi:hypothetical protein